jgi:hypothetical protein
MHHRQDSSGASPHPRARAAVPLLRLAARGGVLALALAGCSMETSYVPRTPHVLALAMKRSEPAVYKDGLLTQLDDVGDLRCAPAASDATAATDHHNSYRRNATIAGICNALGVFAPPLWGVGIFFQIRSADHLQKSNYHLVDMINRFNDESECQR